MSRRIIDQFSEEPILPGHGKCYVPIQFISTKPVLTFQGRKTFTRYLRKTNPRKIRWTRAYRKAWKKGSDNAAAKRRQVRNTNTKGTRAYVGMSLEKLTAKRKSGTRRTQATSAAAAAAKAEKARRK